MRLLAAAALLVLACSPAKRKLPGDDPTAAVVDEARAVLRTGGVGASKPVEATYVLVEVANRSAIDRLVTVGGTLLDEAGAAVGTLGADELRIPAGGTRVYALVTEKPVPAARRARFEVLNAVPVDYPPQVQLSGEAVSHGDLTVATAVAKNVIERDTTAVIAAAFFGADGSILSRPFTVVSLAPGATQPVRFEGPKQAARAVVFVGQIAFH